MPDGLGSFRMRRNLGEVERGWRFCSSVRSAEASSSFKSIAARKVRTPAPPPANVRIEIGPPSAAKQCVDHGRIDRRCAFGAVQCCR